MADAQRPIPGKGAGDNAGREEIDERFPSGPWVGFWLQRGFTGRQWMRPLHLHFAGGKISGHGSDCVGDFDLSGAYDLTTGKCQMVKQYLGAHPVLYDGQNEDDGKWIWGVWRTGPDQGGFHLWPQGVEDPTLERLRAEEDLPVEQEVPAA
jgi:hypothetical protein